MVVVLINARPLSVRWEAAHVPALVEAWEPGNSVAELSRMCFLATTIRVAGLRLPFPERRPIAGLL